MKQPNANSFLSSVKEKREANPRDVETSFSIGPFTVNLFWFPNDLPVGQVQFGIYIDNLPAGRRENPYAISARVVPALSVRDGYVIHSRGEKLNTRELGYLGAYGLVYSATNGQARIIIEVRWLDRNGNEDEATLDTTITF